jgi:hypothetical protein
VTSYEDAVAAIGAARDGVVPAAVAAESGVPASALQSMRRRGLLVHECRGVDRLRDHPLTWQTECRIALVAAGPGAAIGLRSAARLLEFYAYRSTTAVEVLVPRRGDHRAPYGRLVRTRSLPDDHITTVAGFPVTTPARTFFDLCGDPDYGLPVAHPAHVRAMRRVYNDALARRGLTFTLEAATLLVLAEQGRAGTQLVRDLLRELGPLYVPTHSETESIFMELVHAFSLPEPEKQVPMSDRFGWIGNVDFLWRAARHVVEVDSRWHDGPVDQIEDARRDERLRAAGYTVARYRYGDVVLRANEVARELGGIVGR